MKKVVADASSLILLAKCSLLENLTAVVQLYIPEKVLQECTGGELIDKYPDAAIITELVKQQKIHVMVPSKGKMEKGEDEAVALFEEIKADLFLCDDGRAIKICRVLQIPFTTSPRVVVDLYRKNLIDIDRAKEALNRLEILGRYSKDIIANALLDLMK